MKKLKIPNSVVKVGDYCFHSAKISDSFHFSSHVHELPKGCFYRASVPDFKFLKNVTSIGDACFSDMFIMETVELDFSQVTNIGEEAFKRAFDFNNLVEISSMTQYIGADAFEEHQIFSLICRSYYPMKVDLNCFRLIKDDSKLYVPKGTKFIYENISPWNQFESIEEIDEHKTLDCNRVVVDLPDDEWYKNLMKINDSIRNVDRVFMQDNLSLIAQSYFDIDSDTEFNEAMALIKYKNRFNPPLLPDLERAMCQNWPNRYKLKMLSECMATFSNAPLMGGIEALAVEAEAKRVVLPMFADPAEPLVSFVEERKDEVFFSEILTHLQNELSLAKQSLKIAVSWFTNYALFRQVRDLAAQGVDVRLIINNDSVNNGGYCLDLNELINVGVHVSLVQYPHLLHDKFCIIDDRVLINGSYNWTRFSGNNYENVVITRNNQGIVDQFIQEFEKLSEDADLKDVSKMPDTVPERPEYDRNAFRQYITEELDAEAKEATNERDKVTATRKAAKLNSQYLDYIHPGIVKQFEKAMEVDRQAETVAKDIVNIAKTVAPAIVRVAPVNASSSNSTSSTATPRHTNSAANEATLAALRTSSLFMVLDVSGSMEDTYRKGHVEQLAKKALAAALAISDSQDISLWKFGNDATYVGQVGLSNIDRIDEVKCQQEGTYLVKFVQKSDQNMVDGSFAVILTDDDGSSIQQAIPGMKSKEKVFWQIIAYESGCPNIQNAVSGCKNIAFACLHDYEAKSDKEVNEMMLKEYIAWKGKQS